ncbi:hypothetical protein K2Z84_05150 [Candidatus Binatia bacterium]|nr:hypothetical protein [Candidatus Binatia bacterium]
MKLPIPDWLIDAIVRRAKRRPYAHLTGYMERYWLFRTRWLACRLHVILRSDDDRALHDHPWDYATVILRGGYTEITPNPFRLWDEPWRPIAQRRERIEPGRVLFRRVESLHRLEVPDGSTCLTMFFTRPKRRTWGFQTPQGWVSHHDYERMIAGGVIPHARRKVAS